MRLRGCLSALSLVFCFAWCTGLNGQVTASAIGQFAYSGDDGPGFWSKFDERCASSSSRQSPINIDHVVEDPHLAPLDLSLSSETRVELVNPGYTLQANAAGRGFLTIEGEVYTLLQFHFHALSEHTVEAKRGVMELHMVFENAERQYAVIGVIYKLGKPNPFVQKLVDAGLPETTHSAPVTIDDLNIERALTDTSAYYRYAGSLTTPPCSQNVTWLVLKQWAEMSSEQFEAFRRILGNDFRPLQRRNDRVIRGTVRREASVEATSAAPDK